MDNVFSFAALMIGGGLALWSATTIVCTAYYQCKRRFLQWLATQARGSTNG